MTTILVLAGLAVMGPSLAIGMLLGRSWERARSDASQLSTYEAVRLVYRSASPAEVVDQLRGPLRGRPDPSLTDRRRP